MQNNDKRAARLQEAMHRSGVESAAELARRTGLVENTVRTHLLGRRGFKQDAAERYARVLGVSVAWLYTGDELRKPDPASIPPAVPSRIPVIGKLRNADEEYLLALEEAAKAFAPLIKPGMSPEELAWRLQKKLEEIKREVQGG